MCFILFSGPMTIFHSGPLVCSCAGGVESQVWSVCPLTVDGATVCGGMFIGVEFFLVVLALVHVFFAQVGHRVEFKLWSSLMFFLLFSLQSLF